MTENPFMAGPFRSPVEDYFARPECPDEVADVAYQEFVRQSIESAGDFGHWLEAQAWRVTFRSRESITHG